jgi:hypothetical protein
MVERTVQQRQEILYEDFLKWMEKFEISVFVCVLQSPQF